MMSIDYRIFFYFPLNLSNIRQNAFEFSISSVLCYNISHFLQDHQLHRIYKKECLPIILNDSQDILFIFMVTLH